MTGFDLVCPRCKLPDTLDYDIGHLQATLTEPSRWTGVLAGIRCDECGGTWDAKGHWQGVDRAS